MKTLFITLFFFNVSLGLNAQEIKGSARQGENKEIVADNHLKKTIQQKQLSAPPERIADTSVQSSARKDLKKKKRRCCTKAYSKA